MTRAAREAAAGIYYCTVQYSYSYVLLSSQESRPSPTTSTRTRLGASSEQVVRDVNPDMGFRVFDKPTSES